MFHDALAWLHSIRRFGSKAGLERVRALTARLGHPERSCRFVHVTGTNGKGSTAAMIESILRASGLLTGLFVSPFVEDFRERLRIGGEMLTGDEWALRLSHARESIEGLLADGGPQPTEFETLTALALLCFAEHGCDIAVLEVGMGGRSDATNVIPAPQAAVITPVSLDHMQYLGGTLSEIAAEKCGIIKPGCRVVTSAGQPGEVMEIIRRRCAEVGAGAPVCPDWDALGDVSFDWEGTRFRYQGQAYALPLIGGYQAQNALTAIETARALRHSGLPVREGNIADGLRDVSWGGRLEIIGRRPMRLIDGAHNPAKMAALCRAMDALLSGRRLITVMGMSADKDCAACVPLIACRSEVLLATQYTGARSLPAHELAGLAGDHAHTEAYARLHEACTRALALAGPEDVILACGSLYMIGEAKRLLA